MLDGSMTLWLHETPEVDAHTLTGDRMSVVVDEDLTLNGPADALLGLAERITQAIRREALAPGFHRAAQEALHQGEALADEEDARLASVDF